MNEQDRLKEIANATNVVLNIVSYLPNSTDNDIALADLTDLFYRLGYIEGLSYVPEDGDGEQ